MMAAWSMRHDCRGACPGCALDAVARQRLQADFAALSDRQFGWRAVLNLLIAGAVQRLPGPAKLGCADFLGAACCGADAPGRPPPSAPAA